MNPEYKLLSVDKVELDLENPRIRRFLEMYEGGTPTPDQIYMALGSGGDDSDSSGTSFEKLKQSILTNGGIIQPIIVNKSGRKYVCIEGNTRLALYQSFDADDYPGKWDKIPCLVHSNLSQDQIDSIRLQIHLVGTRQWDPYSKAKYLHHLRTQQQMPWSSIVDFAGGRKREVSDLVAAYEDMEKYYREVLPDDTAFDPTRFSGFVELQKTGIKEAVASAGFDISDFASWIHENKLHPLNLVRKLPAILKKPEAREIFLNDGARLAEKALDRPDLSKTLEEANIVQLAEALTQAIYNVGWSERDEITTSEKNLVADALSELDGVVKKFLEASGS